jgi:hypothetical protein
MPVVIQGLVETKRALREFAPDLKRELDKEGRALLKGIVNDARGFVPATGDMLSGWQIHSKGKQITAQTSVFSRRAFPMFQASEVKTGLVAKVGGMKRTRGGMRAEYAIQNKSAAGAIYEWAGRVNRDGLPWEGPTASPGNRKVSHSNNPKAGKQFIDRLDETDNYRQIHGKRDGRLAYRAVEQNNGRAIRAFTNAVLKAEKTLQTRLNARKAFGGEL